MRIRRAVTIIAATALTLWTSGQTGFAADRRGEHWVGTWGASPQRPGTPVQFNGQTLRQIVHVSVGGTAARVTLSNEFGTTPLTIGAAHIAVRAIGSAIVPESDRVLTFGGAPSAIIPAGAPLMSDAVDLDVPTLGDLAISIYLPDVTAATTVHSVALQTSYISAAGDYTDAVDMPVATTTHSWYLLAGVSVNAHDPTAIAGESLDAFHPTAIAGESLDAFHPTAIVALGDSITDGNGSTTDMNNRWPNQLAERLLREHHGRDTRMGVLDQGISGNRVLTDGSGVNALARFDRDVLTQPGVAHVIVLEGINDSGSVFVADQIVAGLAQLIARAHARGLRIYGGTLTPAGSAGTREDNRQAVNDWIRTSGEFDAVIDFDEAVRDPDNPTFFLPAYDSGDHLHPSDAGYRAMADAIDLSLFRGRNRDR